MCTWLTWATHHRWAHIYTTTTTTTTLRSISRLLNAATATLRIIIKRIKLIDWSDLENIRKEEISCLVWNGRLGLSKTFNRTQNNDYCSILGVEMEKYLLDTIQQLLSYTLLSLYLINSLFFKVTLKSIWHSYLNISKNVLKE